MDEPSVVLTKDLAHAVLDMEDIGFGEGLGPETEEATRAWIHLISLSELRVQRLARCNRWKKEGEHHETT